MYGRISFKRNELILSFHMDLLLSIIKKIFTNVKDSHGGIRKLSFGFNFLLQKSLSDLEQAKLSVVNPFD